MLLKLFELHTEDLDNSVVNRFLSHLTNVFYYGFVTLNNFNSVIIIIVISIS